MALADTARLIASLELDPRKFNKGLSASEKALGRMESKAFRAGQHIGTGIKNIARIGAGVATAVGGISAASLKIAGDFEAQLNTINTIARETPEGLSRIGDTIRKMARDTGTPLEELTQGFYDLLSAGIQAGDAQRVLAASNRLAIGGLATTAETVDLLTTALNTYGKGAKSAGTIADIFAKAIERGKVTAADLASSFAQIGPVAAAAGISIKEVSAGFARLTASGVPAAEAATQMRSAIIALTRRTGDLKKLEKQTGRNYLSLAGRKGLVAALEQLRIDADKAGVPLIDLLGRVEGVSFALQTTGPNFDKYNADLAAMGNAAGTAAKQMGERQKGLNFEIGRLKALAKDAGITIGSELLPKITPLFTRLNQELIKPGTQKAIRDFGESIAGLFTDRNIDEGVEALKGAFRIAKDAAPAIADAARISGDALKVAVGVFKSLPPDIQKLAAVALGVNKLTGGLITSLGKDVFGTLFSRGSSPANPMWVQQVGGVAGGATGTAAAGGKGILSFLGPLGALAAIAEAIKPEVNKQTGGNFENPFAGGIGGNIITGLHNIEEAVKLWGRNETASQNDAARRIVRANESGSPDDRQAIRDVEKAAREVASQTQRAGERISLTEAQTKAAVDASKARMAAELAATRREDTRGSMIVASSARSAGERARGGGLAAAAAINRKNFSPRISVVNNLRLSVRDTQQKLTFQQNMAING